MLPILSFWLRVYVNGVFIITQISILRKTNINNYLSVPQNVA